MTNQNFSKEDLRIRNAVINVIGPEPTEIWRYYRQPGCYYCDPDELVNEDGIQFWHIMMDFWTVKEGRLEIDEMLISLYPTTSEQEIIFEVIRLIQNKQSY